MAAVNPETLVLLAQALQANIVADLTAAGLAVPARRIITHGTPVRECDQLAIWLMRIDTGGGADTTPRATQGPTTGAVTHITDWGVDLSLCGQSATAEPTAAAITADALMGLRYTWALRRSLTSRWTKAAMFDPIEQQMPAGKGVTVAGVQGDMDGGLITVTASFSANTRDVPV